MGACGCGDFVPQFKFPGPEGFWYTLEIKEPCRDCDTPLGIRISRLSTAMMDQTDSKDCPDLKLISCGCDDKYEDWKDAYISILNPSAIAKQFKQFFGGDDAEEIYCDEVDASNMICDAVAETQNPKECEDV